MGYINEPKGVDFIIESKPLTDDERKKISEFIKADKAKMREKKRRSKKIKSPKKKQTTSE